MAQSERIGNLLIAFVFLPKRVSSLTLVRVMIDVLIHSPFPQQDGQGNSATADRLEKIFLEAGLSVVVEHEWYGGCEADCFVALNARRSAGAVEEFRDACPESDVVVVLTGTDINHPEMANATSLTRQTMQDADRLVLLHEGSLPLVPEDWHEKCQVIYPSVILPEGLSHHPDDTNAFSVVMAGNVRSEKNIPVVMAACGLLSDDSVVSVEVYGLADEVLAQKMRVASESIPSFDWRGKISHSLLMEKLATSDVLLNSSTQEGGANAICEAISLGLPVVASRISGNVGMLGEKYGGYFPSGDARALADLLSRCAENQVFYHSLKQQIEARALLFTYAEESRLWLEVVGG